MTWVAIAIGGALGAMARHAVNQAVHAVALSGRVPVGTLIVNISGCFVIGALAGLIAAQRLSLPFSWREFVFVGLLGGFTTFSTFGLDTFVLLRTHGAGAAFWSVAGQVSGGLAAVWMGYHLGTAGR